MAPGILLAWSGVHPMSRVVRVPEQGELVVGRSLLEEDDRVSRSHARISWRDGVFTISDLGGRNVTRIEGKPMDATGTTKVRSRVVVRFGNSIGILLDDIGPYEAGGVTRHARWIGGRRSGALHVSLAEAAERGAHLVVVGDPGIGRGHLARNYASLLAPLRTHFEEEPSHDPEELLMLLDSLACNEDLRVVFTQNNYARAFPPRLSEFLDHHAVRIELPPLRERADELAAIIVDAVTRIDPQLRCHANLFEYFLTHPRNLSEIFGGLVDVARGPHEPVITIDDFVETIQRNWVRIIPAP